MNRFDRSCVRAFFTLPNHLRELPNTFIETLLGKPFSPKLTEANSIIYKNTKFYIIWFDHPESLTPQDKIDLSFRDFTHYRLVPVVLIRKSVNPDQTP